MFPRWRVIASRVDHSVGPHFVPGQSITMITAISVFVIIINGWLGSRVVSVLDSGAEGPGSNSQSRRCRVTVLGKLFTPIVPLFTKQQNW